MAVKRATLDYFPLLISVLGEGNGTPLQYSCLENPRDRGAWWAAVYGVAQSRQSQTRLKWFSNNLCSSPLPHAPTTLLKLIVPRLPMSLIFPNAVDIFWAIFFNCPVKYYTFEDAMPHETLTSYCFQHTSLQISSWFLVPLARFSSSSTPLNIKIWKS